MSKATVKRLIALMVGVATITAGLFTWRAGQIGSQAAFDDRQAIGEQVDLENVQIDVAVEASRQARQYDRYVAEYDVAAALEREADEADRAGRAATAEALRLEARQRRVAATERAAATGVFGTSTLSSDPDLVSEEPAPFDLTTRIDSLLAEETTGLRSAGDVDPQRWADSADDIRDRIRNLTYWVAVLLVAVVALTAAEVTVNRRIRRGGLAFGTLLVVVAWAGALSTGFTT